MDAQSELSGRNQLTKGEAGTGAYTQSSAGGEPAAREFVPHYAPVRDSPPPQSSPKSSSTAKSPASSSSSPTRNNEWFRLYVGQVGRRCGLRWLAALLSARLSRDGKENTEDYASPGELIRRARAREEEHKGRRVFVQTLPPSCRLAITRSRVSVHAALCGSKKRRETRRREPTEKPWDAARIPTRGFSIPRRTKSILQNRANRC